MAKCCNCKNLETKDNGFDAYSWCEKINDCPHEDIERNCEHYEPMTNADRIRNMTDEELAETIMCPFDIIGSNETCNYKRNCQECALAWLQKESEE